MRLRRLTTGEVALMAEAFGGGIDPRRIRLLTGAPTRGLAFVAYAIMVFPVDCADFAGADIVTQAWFIHEAAHVWQFQHRPFWTLGSWLKGVITGGYGPGRSIYRYALPIVWERLNLEQQARVVEHGWLMRRGVRVADMPEGASAADYPLPVHPLPDLARPR